MFISLDFEMRFDNFTRVTCILYIDLVETLNFLLRNLVENVAKRDGNNQIQPHMKPKTEV